MLIIGLPFVCPTASNSPTARQTVHGGSGANVSGTNNSGIVDIRCAMILRVALMG